MKSIGNKIEDIRKMKGLTQEELAELAQVNLRTIQRIENNESEPRGYTMKNICTALSVNIEDILDYGKEEDLSFLAYFHLSILCFLFLPLGNIIVPAILWLSNKRKVLHLDTQAKNVINFQILHTSTLFLLMLAWALLKLEGIDLGWNVLLIYFGLHAINIILVIRAWFGIKKGSIKKYFPQLIQFIG